MVQVLEDHTRIRLEQLSIIVNEISSRYNVYGCKILTKNRFKFVQFFLNVMGNRNDIIGEFELSEDNTTVTIYGSSKMFMDIANDIEYCGFKVIIRE